jgi:hypothetical protein
METLLEESQGIGVEEFIVRTKFQDLTLHVAHITIDMPLNSSKDTKVGQQSETTKEKKS